MEKGRGDGESGASRWPTVGGRSQAANEEPARGGGREVLIGVGRWVVAVVGGEPTYVRICILMLFLHPPPLPVIAS